MKTKYTPLNSLARSVRYGLALALSAVTTTVKADESGGRQDGHDVHIRVQHVLLISVDRLHQSDLAWYVQTHPESAMAWLTAQGVDFNNASTPFP